MTEKDFVCHNCGLPRPIEEKVIRGHRVRCKKCEEISKKGKRLAMMRRANELRAEQK